MLGAISSNKKNTSINVRSIYNNFISSLNDDLLLHLPKNEGLKELNNADQIVDYLYLCWLIPEISYHVASTCQSLCKIFVTRGREDQAKCVEYVHALGKTVAHTNISVDCYNFLASKAEILKEGLSTKETINLLSGITSIVKNVPQCKDLVCKEDLLRLWKSSDTEIKRSAEHLLAVCNDLNDDVFNSSSPVDYPGDLWKEVVAGDAVMDESEPVYLERVPHLLFSTGGDTLHIRQKEGAVKAVVRTANVEEAIAHVGEAYDARKPVLLQGQIGSGKTLVLEHFASLFGLSQEDVLSVQLDEQTDSKILIGNYVCSEVPGQYIWQPGIITRAACTGKWIIFEDIDHAPSDVISLIKSVTETCRIQTPAAELSTHPNFTIFLTQRVTDTGFGYHHNPVLAMLDNTFTKVRLTFYDDTQLKQVISGKFPALSGCAERLVHLYNSLSNSTLRQLIKWSSRVQGHLTHNLTVVTKEVFLEAVDCFCSWQPCPQKRTDTAYKIGTFLSMPKSKVESYLTSYQPVVSASHTHYTVGRCTLQCGGAPHPTPLFAHTRHTVVLLEKLACAVQHCEPVLLTGETGNGKTASVQHLAARTGNRLVVINMSQQSDAADLIGGFKPLDVVQLMKPLYTTFELLFKESFSVSKNANFLQKVQICWRQKEWGTLLQAILHISKKMPSSKQWCKLGDEADKINKQINQIENSFAFSFIEGSLVQAVRKGDWVLLDEINLAPLEVLESLNCILDGTGFLVVESGNMDVIKKHPNFRLFAAMNPSTDVGKKDLPVGIKNRFTEIFVDELTEEGDLRTLTAAYLHHLNLPSAIISKIVSLYTELRKQAADVLTDGRGHKPCYSIRTLCRALRYIGRNPCGNTLRSLYEGFSLSFLTQLDRSSYPRVRQLIIQHLLPGNTASEIIRHKLPQPGSNHVLVEGYWVERGEQEPVTTPGYILTKTVRENLHDLARAVSSAEYPVLLQGPTSAGKTSVVKYLAGLAGTTVIRINNHEHTDLQEYVGSYCVGENDKLAFKEGLLVEAMRAGHWLILDELNLAPTDVLEALNRVLDDNRELFIAETQTTVKAHPHFMLFATQNPAGSYGGRKTLSRAFRNRFIELHYEDLPLSEIKTIIEERCQLPPSYSKKIMSVMEKLQSSRTKSGIFAGRHGLITLRDLFRWADRYRLSAESGKFTDWDQLLANDGYMLLTGKVRRYDEEEIIKSVLAKVFKRSIDTNTFFDGSLVSLDFRSMTESIGIVWTPSMMRLLTLVSRSLEFKEPVLLIGETGCGKTTICQVMSVLKCLKLHILNCHMHSDTADFIGSLRPVRDRSGDKLFEWVDGPLIEAMKKGDMILLDEISLADDSVLERLNSVLEVERQLTLAESSESVTLTAHPNFRIVATMNPGGDYGKKELSPALRNRFTEIWCNSGDTLSEMRAIIHHHLTCGDRDKISEMMVQFIGWFQEHTSGKPVVTVRDALTWTTFLNETSELRTSSEQRYLHGAHLILVGGLSDPELKEHCRSYLSEQCGEVLDLSCDVRVATTWVDFGSLRVKRGSLECPDLEGYSLGGPTTTANILRITRGLQVDKPILLEGHPGVGKTSLTSALAKLLGYRLTRINLSEQTDMSDLFGCDLPSEDGSGFCWRDGPLLKALKLGNWVLLDEMNLASQAVLEGLNACLDHRGELYVPELSKTFTIGRNHNKTRFIACMNPVEQGGGRKELPKSFLNRFVKVYIEMLTKEDMMLVLSTTHPHIPSEMLVKMISFNWCIHEQVCIRGEWGKRGSPWEFNLRDTRRWCDLISTYPHVPPSYFIDTVYTSKFRCTVDREKVRALRSQSFSDHVTPPTTLLMSSDQVQMGPTVLTRHSANVPTSSYICSPQLRAMETLAHAVNMNWMSILIGPSNSGKSTTLRTFAAMCGRDVLEIGCSSVFDISDLLGGFSQVSKSAYVETIRQLVNDLMKELIVVQHGSLDAFLAVCQGLHNEDKFEENVGKILQILSNGIFPEKTILIQEQISFVISKIDKSSDGTFEWRNSRFVDALIEGRWVLLDNANLISPSVLDRLNPLLEQNGVLVLDERGYVNGEAVVVTPHPDFRLFMTMEPRYGELSRPMRNRGVEIYLDNDYQIKNLQQPLLLPQNSAAFNVNLYCHLFRKVSDKNSDYREEVMRTSLGYLPFSTWPLMLSLFGNSLSSAFLASTRTFIETKDGQGALTPSDSRLSSWTVLSDSSFKCYSKFVCQSYDLRSMSNSKTFTQMGNSLTTAEWGDLFLFRKFLLLFKMFCNCESGTLWWELREPLLDHPLSSLYDDRFGSSRDDLHWNLVESVGHPPLVQSEELGRLIDSYLMEGDVFASHNDAFLRMLFKGITPKAGCHMMYSCVGNCDSNEVSKSENHALGTAELALLMTEILVDPIKVNEDDRNAIRSAVFPHISPYLRWSLRAFAEQSRHLTDVLAYLICRNSDSIETSDKFYTNDQDKVLDVPSISSFDQWIKGITETISNMILRSLIGGSSILESVRESHFKAIRSISGNRTDKVELDTLLQTMEKTCSLSRSDPVKHYTILHTSTLAFVELLGNHRAIHCSIQSYSQGGGQVPESTYPFTSIQQHLETARTTLSETACKLGYRSGQPSYGDLSEELATFNRIVCQRASELKGDQAKVESWMKSVGTFISKTYTKYWHFRDVLAPFVMVLYCLSRAIEDSVKLTTSKNQPIFTLFDRIDRLIRVISSSIQGSQVAANIKLMDHLVTIYNYRESIATFVYERLTGPPISLVRSYYLSWERNKELREKFERNQESIYKDTERFQEEESVTVNTMFPSYEDFNDLDSPDDAEIDFTETDQSRLSSQDEDKVVSVEVMANYIQRLINLLQTDGDTSQEETQLRLKNCFSLDELEGLVVDRGEALTIGSCWSTLDHFTSSPDSVDDYVDIYRGSYPAQVMGIRPLLQDLGDRIRGLLKTWPDHPALIQIKTVVERIEGFPLDQPVIKFLQGLEILLTKCQLWESIASREVSMSDTVEKLTQQIIQWRSNELRSWPLLLDQAHKNHLSRTNDNFLKLANLVIESRYLETGTQCSSFVSAVFVFIEDSSVGDFQERLQYLRLCSDKLDIHGKIKKVLHALYFYFNLFKDLVKKELDNSTAGIKKELKDYVKIVRWKDVNYFSVKQSTEASHQKLVKFIKQYEVCLRNPVTMILEKDDILPLPTQTSSPLPQQRIDMVVGLGTMIKESLSELQEASCTVAKIEDKDKRLKALKGVDLRKRKALSDLFKCLSHCGLSFTKGLSLNFSVDCFYSMMSETYPSPESAWILHNLKTLLQLVTNPSDQIGPTELDRIKGFSGHLFGIINETLNLRDQSREHLSTLEKIDSNLLSGQYDGQQSAVKNRLSLLVEKAVPLQDCFHQTLYLTDAITRLDNGAASFSRLYDKDSLVDGKLISDVKANVENLRIRLQNLVKAVDYPEHIFTSVEATEVSDLERLVEETLAHLETLANKKQTLFSNVPTTLPLLENLSTAVKRIKAITVAPTTVKTTSMKEMNSLLASVKLPLFKTCSNPKAEDWGCEKGIFVNQLRDLRDLADAADLERSLTVISEILVSSSFYKPLPTKVLYRVRDVVGGLQEYCEELLKHLATWLSHGLLPLTETLVTLFRDIIKRGYCKPEELEEAEREGGEMFDSSESGGIGEGQGAADVSDQIESQEQVEGTRNEEKEEQEDVSEEKDGLEMEDDFEGALGDMERDEEGEDSGHEEQEDSDNDEQMGDVDNPEDKQKSETFGENDEKLPDSEAEADRGAQSEQQDEMVAKDNDLDHDSGVKEAEDQELQENDEVEAEEYNAEDDVPDPEAPGQPDDEHPPQAEDLPDNMEGLEDQEDNEGGDIDMEDVEDSGDDLGDSEQEEGVEEGETVDIAEEQEEQSDETNEDIEKVGASAPTHHSEATPDPQAEAESTQGGVEAEQQSAGRDDQDQGQSADPGGESSQAKSDEMESSDLRKRHRENERKQISESSSAKRAKTLPKTIEDHESTNAEVKETDVFEHTEEGESYDKEVMDTTQQFTDQDYVADEKEDEAREESGLMEDYEEELQENTTDKITNKQTDKQNSQQITEEGKEDKVEDSEQPRSERDTTEDVRSSYFSTNEDYQTTRNQLLEQIRSNLMEICISGREDMTEKEAAERWTQFESLTASLSQDLCEQLRLILEPTKAAKLKGDFRTGKRLNMKRIIPYIASKFQKDKIWLRRSKPSSRDYQVMIALDDSASMSSAECVQMSLEAVAVICGALSKLEIGRLGVCGFGSETSLIVPFNEPFTSVSGARIVRHFSFQDTSTDIIRLLELTRGHFAHTASLQSNQPVSQLLFIVSDGRGLYIKGVEAVKKAVKESWDAGVFMVFLIIDKQRGSESILDVRTPIFDSSGKLIKIESYLESFPFPYYVVLRDPADLPGTLADALRQWIEIVANSS